MTEPFEGCRVVALVRSGPVADLYEAIQEPLGRRVLVKALSASILPSSPFAAVLEREARVLASLDHAGIVRLLDFVKRSERMWLVLEHVEGWELEELLRRLQAQDGRPASPVNPAPRSGANPTAHLGWSSAAQGSRLGKAPEPARRAGMDPRAATSIALRVAEALDHAHRRGVVHRELGPRHILLGRDGSVKLAGFSVQLEEHGAPVETVDVTGSRSAAYLAPEQILGEPADPRGDFFSLGVVLYELLSGQNPFGDDADGRIAQRVRHDSPALLSRLVPQVPGSLERLVARCLEKLPGDRFQSAAELVSTLHRILAELGVSDANAAIRGALGAAGLVPEERSLSPRNSGPRERPRGVPLRGLLVASALLVLGGGVIQWVGAATALPGDHAGVTRLELAPEDAASLRVVATPWAHVFIDGQQVATTPFATPIPLRSGTHHVRLDHPKAPSEHRTITLVPGETILLDVTLKIELPQAEVSPTPPPEEDDSP